MKQDIDGSDAIKSNLPYLLLGLILLGTSLYLSAKIQNPDPIEVLILRVIIALGAAFAAVSLPGSVGVDLPKGIKAGGSLAIFVLIFFFNPADLMKPNGGVAPESKAGAQGKPGISPNDQQSTNDAPEQSANSTSPISLSKKGMDGKPPAQPETKQKTIAPPVETKDKVPQTAFVGDWKGNLSFAAYPGIAYPTDLHFATSNNTLALTVDSEAQNYFGIPAEELSVKGSRTTFVVTQTGQFAHISFDCHLQGEQLPCSVQQGVLLGSITFLRR